LIGSDGAKVDRSFWLPFYFLKAVRIRLKKNSKSVRHILPYPAHVPDAKYLLARALAFGIAAFVKRS